MNSCFENFTEEIQAIVAKAKKDGSTITFQIQKSFHPYIESWNGNLTQNQLENIFGVNLSIVTQEGYYIHGSSNRLHLTDVLTRLYQTLENLLKANKGHKVEQRKDFEALNTEQINRIHENNSSIELEQARKLIEEIASKIPQEAYEKLNFKITFSGNYCLRLAGNSQGGMLEFDDSFYEIRCEISEKIRSFNSVSIARPVTKEDILNPVFDIDNLLNEIQFYSSMILKERKKLNPKDIHPEVILFHSNIAKVALYKALIRNASNGNESLRKSDTLNSGKVTFHLSDVVREESKTLAKESLEDIQVTIDFEAPEKEILRQKTFGHKPLDFFKSISVTRENDKEKNIEFNFENLDELIKQLQGTYKINRILFLSGIKTNAINRNPETLISNPSVSIYYNGSDKTFLDVTMVNFKRFNRVELLGKPEKAIFMLETHETPIFINCSDLVALSVGEKEVEVL